MALRPLFQSSLIDLLDITIQSLLMHRLPDLLAQRATAPRQLQVLCNVLAVL